MTAEDARSVEFEVLARLIQDGQLSDVAAELDHFGHDSERNELLALLVKACFDREEHDFIVKIAQTQDIEGLPQDIVQRMHDLAETSDDFDDFRDHIPTVVGWCPF